MGWRVRCHSENVLMNGSVDLNYPYQPTESVPVVGPDYIGEASENDDEYDGERK